MSDSELSFDDEIEDVSSDSSDQGTDSDDGDTSSQISTIKFTPQTIVKSEIVEQKNIQNHPSIQIKNIIDPVNHRSCRRLSRFEMAGVLSKRVAMIENGERVETKLTNPIDIAYEELANRRIPILIVRDMGNNNVEIVDVNQLIHLQSNK